MIAVALLATMIMIYDIYNNYNGNNSDQHFICYL